MVFGIELTRPRECLNPNRMKAMNALIAHNPALKLIKAQPCACLFTIGLLCSVIFAGVELQADGNFTGYYFHAIIKTLQQ
jgi:hypothetical protein